jgi:hypothetical protein
MAEDARPGLNTKRIVFLLWLLVALFYFYLSYNYIRATMNDRQFADYIRHVVQIAGNDRRPAREIRTLLVVKAGELSLPVQPGQITVAGEGSSLKVSVVYNVDIEIPLLQRQIYRKKFEHNESYKLP